MFVDVDGKIKNKRGGVCCKEVVAVGARVGVRGTAGELSKKPEGSLIRDPRTPHQALSL